MSERHGEVSLRFFTGESELPACGHGTVAALAVFAVRSGEPEYAITLHAGGPVLAPDLDRLRVACDRLGLLGCYVHTVPTADGRAAARMFAPSIGVPEDIANANSTACLAAHLSRQGFTTLTVDMGDALSCPFSITATTGTGPAGVRVDVGGFTALATG
ncbi:PhzF family phenazine biosynthesis protein [Nonomuraea sp. NPDC049784]|uniref:PhzF family phenazine biosynthesis protein n=1 Tax=Nonomuraea sp. NPDC049784 TaxID=3154361 RepID=UPI0033C5FEE4